MEAALGCEVGQPHSAAVKAEGHNDGGDGLMVGQDEKCHFQPQ